MARNLKLFKRHEPVLLSCSPKVPWAYDYFKPLPTGRYTPEWFKKTPREIKEMSRHRVDITRGTIKNCPGVIKTLTAGFVIPLWTDIVFRFNPDGSWGVEVADGVTTLMPHSREQFPLFYKNYAQVKLSCPWAALASDKAKFYMTEAFYHLDESRPFKVAPGVLDFYTQHSTNIQLFFPITSESYQVELYAGTPLVQILPLFDNPIKLQHELLDSQAKFDRKFMGGTTPFFYNKYKRVKHMFENLRD